jgi:hypothetical protein
VDQDGKNSQILLAQQQNREILHHHKTMQDIHGDYWHIFWDPFGGQGGQFGLGGSTTGGL